MKYKFPALIIISVSCSPGIVHYLDKKAAYQAFETYDLVNLKIKKNELNENTRRIVDWVESRIAYQMNDQRRYVSVRDDPDLILRYELISNTNSGARPRTGYYSPFPYNPVLTIYELLILLELYHKDKLIWQGSHELARSARKKRDEQAIKNAIDLIFTTYPYRSSSAEADLSLITIKKK